MHLPPLRPLAFLAALSFCAFPAPRAAAAPADLDGSFSGDGKVTTDFGGGNFDSGTAVAALADGKILAAGVSASFDDTFVALARYSAVGVLDGSFGSGGKVLTSLGGIASPAPSVAVQSDGKIVVAAHGPGAGGSDIILLRYTAAGAPDAGFGTGGKVVGSFGQAEFASAVAVQADGKIVVAGYRNNGGSSDFLVARYSAAGVLDGGFGTGGRTLTDFAASDDVCFSMALQGDGKIVTGGYTVQGGSRFALARYTAAGILDADFGAGTGKVVTAFSSSECQVRALAIQPDGRILAAGQSSAGAFDFALARYLPTGALDGTFDTDGRVTTDFGGGADRGRALAIQSDGSILAAGTSQGANADMAVARYLASGALDAGFGAGGKVVTGFTAGSNEDNAGLALQSDGKILAAGSTAAGGEIDFALLRYQGSPPLTAQQAWRLAWFGVTENSGDAADGYDFDRDGLVNLLEWAVNSNPTAFSPASASAVRAGANMEFTYTRSLSAFNAGAAFTVEWSDALAGPAPWSTAGVSETILSSNGTVQQVMAVLPAGAAGRRFVRLRAAAP